MIERWEFRRAAASFKRKIHIPWKNRFSMQISTWRGSRWTRVTPSSLVTNHLMTKMTLFNYFFKHDFLSFPSAMVVPWRCEWNLFNFSLVLTLTRLQYGEMVVQEISKISTFAVRAVVLIIRSEAAETLTFDWRPCCYASTSLTETSEREKVKRKTISCWKCSFPLICQVFKFLCRVWKKSPLTFRESSQERWETGKLKKYQKTLMKQNQTKLFSLVLNIQHSTLSINCGGKLLAFKKRLTDADFFILIRAATLITTLVEVIK